MSNEKLIYIYNTEINKLQGKNQAVKRKTSGLSTSVTCNNTGNVRKT
jgi:hypothetical protein